MRADTLKNEILKERGFDQYDLNFIKRRTGLKEESQALSLIEEDEDLGLIVDEIASFPLVKRQTSKLSLRFLILLLIHKYDQGGIKNKHKLIISKIASIYFDMIYNQMPDNCSIDFSKKPDEVSAKFLFVLSGFFGEYFARFFNQYAEYEQVKESHIKYIEAGLKKEGADKWASQGLIMLEKISERGWLSRFMKTKKTKKGAKADE